MPQVAVSFSLSASPWLADPTLVDQVINRGVIHAEEGQLEEALTYFDEALRINPKNALAAYNRGLAYYEQKEYDHATTAYDQALALDPNFAEAFNGRGVALAYKGKIDRAIADFNEAIRLKPDFAEAVNNRGVAHSTKGDTDRAFADYNEAIRLKPDYEEAFYNRGLAYYSKNERNHAIVDFARAIEFELNLARKVQQLYGVAGMFYDKIQLYIALFLRFEEPLPDETDIQAAAAALVRKIYPKESSGRKAALASNFIAAWKAWEAGQAVTLVQEVQQSPADLLRLMKKKERRAFLDKHYEERKPWAAYVEALGRNPVPADFEKWADKNFPDRQALGLFFGDLRRLDKGAYDKIVNWRRSKEGGSTIVLPDDEFGFPRQENLNNELVAAGKIPTGAEVFDAFRRGDPDARALDRQHAMARQRQLRQLKS
jgi:Flp pilus assembly protein TadD